MPRDASGTYHLPNPPSPFVPNTPATAQDQNTRDVDIAAALTTSVATTGATMTGPLILSGNATNPLGAVTLQQFQAGTEGVGYLPLTGGSLAGPGNLSVGGNLAVLGVVTTNLTVNGTVAGDGAGNFSTLYAVNSVSSSSVDASSSVTAPNIVASSQVTAPVLSAGSNFYMTVSGTQRQFNWAADVYDYYDTSGLEWRRMYGTAWCYAWDVYGNFNIVGQAYKPGGGPWGAASDDRVKQDVAPYTRGLDAVCALQTLSFRYNGQGGMPPPGPTYYGLSAQLTQPIMPELVMQLGDRGGIPDMLGTDMTALPLALVNAVRELRDTRVAKGGDVMSGPLTLPGRGSIGDTPSLCFETSNTGFLRQIGADPNILVQILGTNVAAFNRAFTTIVGELNVAGDLSVTNHRITNVVAPADALDAANKFYVDAALAARPVLAQSRRIDIPNSLFVATDSYAVLWTDVYQIPRGGNSRLRFTVALNASMTGGIGMLGIRCDVGGTIVERRAFVYFSAFTNGAHVEFFMDTSGVANSFTISVAALLGAPITILGGSATPYDNSQILITDLGPR